MKYYIIYSTKDKNIARRLNRILKQNSETTIIDGIDKITIGTNVIESIEDKIKSSDAIFIVFSEDSSRDEIFNITIGMIISKIIGGINNKKIIPILTNSRIVVPPMINQYASINIGIDTEEKVDKMLSSKFSLLSMEVMLGKQVLSYSSVEARRQRNLYLFLMIFIVITLILAATFLATKVLFSLHDKDYVFFIVIIIVLNGFALGTIWRPILPKYIISKQKEYGA